MIKRFPKVDSPLVREERDGGYYVTKHKNTNLNWVFDEAEDEHTVASEKLDGTNCAVKYLGNDIEIWTRMGQNDMNEVRWLSTDRGMIVDGVLRAWRRGWIRDYAAKNDVVYGELIGEKIQGNRYDIEGHLFVPFAYLRDKCAYETYGKYETGKEPFETWFERGLIPLFYARWHNTSFDEAAEKCQPEGVVFYNYQVEDWKYKYAKLRYDMFNL